MAFSKCRTLKNAVRVYKPIANMSEKPVVLALFANNNDENYLKALNKEAENLKTYWKPLKGSIEMVCEIYTDRQRLAEHLDDYRDRIIGLHFGGHANGEKLIFEDGAVSSKDIVYKLKNEVKQLQFVFLNGCSTEGHVERLIKECNVNFVIATRSSIDDNKAQQFAGWFYQNLYTEEETTEGFRYKKRTLQEAYESALANLKINFSDQDWDDSIETISAQRGLGHPPTDNPWKLYISDLYKNNYPWWLIANLKLTNAPTDKHYLKIFCIHRIIPELADYYNEFEAIVQSNVFLLLNGMNKVSAVINKDAIISEVVHADLLLFLLDDSNLFSEFWKTLGIEEYCKDKNIIFTNIKYNAITHELLKKNLYPSYEIPGLIPFFKTTKSYNISSVSDEINNIVYPEFNEQIKKITQEIPVQLRQIDLTRQQYIFDDQWPKLKDKKVKLVLIEGSEKCGQLTLIKRFLDIGIVDKKAQKQVISFKNNGIDTAEGLYQEIKRAFGFNQTSQHICESLLQINQELILIFDNVVSINFDGYSAVKTFWNKLNECAKIVTPKNQLIIFVISRNYDFTQKDKRTLTNIVGSDTCAVIDLEPITPIEETHWTSWRKNVQPLLKKSEDEINNFQCPVPFPAYLQDVILETGKKLQVPPSFILDNI